MPTPTTETISLPVCWHCGEPRSRHSAQDYCRHMATQWFPSTAPLLEARQKAREAVRVYADATHNTGLPRGALNALRDAWKAADAELTRIMAQHGLKRQTFACRPGGG